jgi:hypothetical protein
MQSESAREGDEMESDYRYHSRRAAEEHRRAAYALTPAARERHSELAHLFAAKAASDLRLLEGQRAAR